MHKLVILLQRRTRHRVSGRVKNGLERGQRWTCEISCAVLVLQ